MKAWEIELKLRNSAVPNLKFKGEYGVEEFAPSLWNDDLLKMIWRSVVPGSGAPESLILGAIQAVENMGRDGSRALELYHEGLKALENENMRLLRVTTARIFEELSRSRKIPDHPYHSYSRPLSWKDISRDFPKRSYPIVREYEESVMNGWIGQIAGASMGTRLEGYKHENLVKIYGEKLGYYLELPPSTINDDVTYEIAFLEALGKKGDRITSKDVAMKWIELIKFGWSAEMMALENLRRGIFPPRSGTFMNPFQEWIGAQMRCMVHGLLNPGNPLKAGYFAYLDSRVSHSGNGVYGGIHSAVLTSLAFSMENPRDLVLEAEKFVPKGSEFERVVRDVRRACQKSSDWKEVLEYCEERFKTYNWIHLYPNTASVITSLWFSDGDFDRAMKIVASFGYDVDCNAGEVGTVLGIVSGVPGRWSDPLNDTLETYVPGYEKVRISDMAEITMRLSKYN